jgi:hypothetical protein
VTDSEEIRTLELIGLATWAPGKRDHFIRISPVLVNGRRIGTWHLTAAGDARHL